MKRNSFIRIENTSSLNLCIKISSSDKRACLSLFNEALHFPDYFGWNWDALQDLLTDLEWLNCTNLNVSILFDLEKLEVPPQLTSVLCDADRYWKATSFLSKNKTVNIECFMKM